MKGIGIREEADGVLALLSEAGYSDRHIHEASRVLNVLCRLHGEAGATEFDREIVDGFVSESLDRHSRGELCRSSYLNYSRFARYLTSYHERAEVALGARSRESGLCEEFEDLVGYVRSSPEWAGKKANTALKSLRPFLKWAQGRGRSTVGSVGEGDVRSYFVEASAKMTPASVYTIRNDLRRLFSFLHDEGVMASDFSDALSFPVRPERRVHKPAPACELAAALDEVDRSTPKGARDYAIILLGAVLGLRAVDIAGLELRDIDWAKGEVAVRQSKTGKVAALPLTADVGRALRSYILGARPDTGDAHVFMTCCTPVAPIGPSTPYQVLNTYRAKAGLPKSPFHGLRRAVGTGLVAGGVPITTVAQVLGHSDIEPTKRYIALDTASLGDVSLGLAGLPPLAVGSAS